MKMKFQVGDRVVVTNRDRYLRSDEPLQEQHGTIIQIKEGKASSFLMTRLDLLLLPEQKILFIREELELLP